MRLISLVATVAFFAGISGCVQNPVVNPSQVEGLSKKDYAELMSRHTQSTNQYAGFDQTFQADTIILDSEVQTAMLRQRAVFKGWDQAHYQTEREKSQQESSAYSKYAIRLFAPEKDYDDLDKAKTIWKVYLEYGGSRFEGKARKMTEKLVELMTLFPTMDRFSTLYEITFNVPMNTVEQGPSKLILTSSLGTAEFKFPAGK